MTILIYNGSKRPQKAADARNRRRVSMQNRMLKTEGIGGGAMVRIYRNGGGGHEL